MKNSLCSQKFTSRNAKGYDTRIYMRCSYKFLSLKSFPSSLRTLPYTLGRKLPLSLFARNPTKLSSKLTAFIFHLVSSQAFAISSTQGGEIIIYCSKIEICFAVLFRASKRCMALYFNTTTPDFMQQATLHSFSPTTTSKFSPGLSCPQS